MQTMEVRCFRGVTACALVVLALAGTAVAQQIKWQTGPLDTRQKGDSELQATLQDLAGQPQASHVVVQFKQPLSTTQREQLGNAGLRLQNYLGGNAYFAAVTPHQIDAGALTSSALLRDIEPAQLAWKLHPMLHEGQIPNWAVVDDGTERKPESPEDPIVGAYVLFFPDVALTTEAVNTAVRHGAKVRSLLKSVNGLVIELPFSRIADLAGEDVVQWVEPPLPRMVELNNSNRVRTGADIVQAPPYGLDGSGVTVLVYDGGYGLASHGDFGGRLTVRDSSGLSDHSTHVAGTIGGSGAGSGGTYKGMAPGVTIQSYGFEQEGGLQEGFLYTDPGDIEVDYSQAISVYGADISNNSIGTNTAPNGFPCEWEGNYGVTGNLIDTIVRGDGSNPLFSQPFRVVWANGNERQGSATCGATYHTTAPPACAKNHITVGALNSNDDSVTSFTSWGPCDDNRMKPDISAPGCQSNDDTGVTSCSSSGGYTVKCGTSMACPTVCGLGALLLQDFRIQYPGEPDFRNSTLKVFLAHTALDIMNPGPDYQTGYGSVRIQPAIDLMRSGNFLEDEVSQGETVTVLAVVAPSDTELKVTLAWDDVPGTPNVNPVLVNDLDLRVFSPSGVQAYPWTLGGLANPSAPAVRTQPNHVDNIEQVFVSSPQAGAWRVEIHGFNVPQGPQPFSVAATPQLVACAPQGVISLDRNKYACESIATIQVVDCDLNTNDAAIETVTVTLASTSEPAGESVLLTETAPETAAFRASIPLSEIDGAAVLLVTAGDTVTATYVDADDGQGGFNVIVTDTAVVDCSPPVISNVQATNVEPRSATVTFDTDENANGAIHYGLSCAALTDTAVEGGFKTVHSLALADLTDNTTYFYAVDATDEAGNFAMDDNGGVCYSFATPEIPDFFTEQFGGDNDLDNLTILFEPNGSFDFYSACAEPITELPTDPSGGTTLVFSDDDNEAIVVPGGASVSLYGVGYTTFHPGSNGYITFTAGDGDYDETLADHFDTPRVSALFDDLNPSTGGTISWKQAGDPVDRVVVTWLNVPEYQTTNSNTFQIELYFDGRIQISYLSIAASDGIAGLSGGGGVPADFFETDLSAVGNCGPQPPVAISGTENTPVYTAIMMTLEATDDGLPAPPATLDYIITQLPSHGVLRDPGAGEIDSVPYTLVGGGNEVEYAPYPCYRGGDSVQFKVNDGGTPPEGGDSAIATVSIAVTVSTGTLVLREAFPLDTNPGWSTQGLWAFGKPTGGGTHNFDPTGGFTGNQVYGYNLAGDYTNNMASTLYLTTPAIDCSAQVDTELRFRRWLGVEGSLFDHASVQVSSDGINWTTAWQNGSTAISDTSWSLQTIDISSVADGQNTVYVRWGIGPTDGGVTYPGWNIDDVEIWAIPVPGSDLNGDQTVDVFDYSIFNACFTGPEVSVSADYDCADLDDDGDVDLVDFSLLQAENGG